MIARRLAWRLVFALCTVAVSGVMSWVTVEVIRLEAAEQEARVEAAEQEALRLALWRIDSWFAPHFAREATRPYYEYLPYYSHERAYTRLLHAIEPHEVHTASPLLAFQSELLLLHFQVGEGGGISSPQVPTGNLRDLAESTGLPAAHIESKQRMLEQLRPLLADFDRLERSLTAIEKRLDLLEGEPADERVLLADVAESQQMEEPQVARSKLEQSHRAQSYDWAQKAVGSDFETPQRLTDEGDAVKIGRLAPILPDQLGHHDGNASDRLLLLRRVRIEGQTHLQGALIDLVALRRAMAARIDDLFPEASFRLLRDREEAEAAEGRAMALIPVALVGGEPAIAGAAGEAMSPSRVMLAVAWSALLITVLAVGVTLHASIAYGERRSRFASAVTHELRTPLTTFRMYSEMLSAGMVQDEAQRASYFQTLHSEADRLSRLVENVLSYARLERGRAEIAAQPMALHALLERLIPPLRARAEDAEVQLNLSTPVPDDVVVKVDPEAAGQILYNLVDNACKYARCGGRIDLAVQPHNGWILVDVRDHGPGISSEHERRIFQAFDRGAREAGDTMPGVGLGLALSRGLAKRLGGDLTLDRSGGTGACFRLRLPRVQ